MSATGSKRVRDGSRWSRIRAIARVADEHLRPTSRWKTTLMYAGDPKAFRRAFVEASLAEYYTVQAGTFEGVEIRLPIRCKGGTEPSQWPSNYLILKTDGAGSIICLDDTIMPAPMPKNIDEVASILLSQKIERMQRRYAELTGKRFRFLKVMVFMEVQKSIMRACAGKLVKTMKQAINPQIVRQIHSSMVFDSRQIRLLGSTNPVIRRNVNDAYRDYPALVFTLLREGRITAQQLEADMAKAGSIPKLLAQYYRISQTGRIKRFHGISVQKVCIPYRTAPGVNELKAMMHMPAHLFPTKRKEFHKIASIIAVSLNTQLSRNVSEEHWFKGIGSRETLMALELADLRGICDAGASMARELGVGRAGAPLAGLDELTLLQAINMSKKWHACVREATASIRRSAEFEFDTCAWKPALAQGERFQRMGYAVRELTSRNDLFIEGDEMRHCVATYTRFCLAGDARIFSIRGKEGKRVATLEIRLGNEGLARRAQLSGPHNSAPPKKVETFAGLFIEAINTGKIKASMKWPRINRKDISQQQKKRRIATQKAERAFWIRERAKREGPER